MYDEMTESGGSLEGEAMPEEISGDQAEQQRQEQQAILNALGATISKLRDEAVKGRAASGIEQEWLEDEEHYEGIDDANRAEMPRKSLSMSGSVKLTGNETKSSGNRSTIFLNISRPYVDAASARVSDMLLPTDDRNWAIKPTPIPELIKGQEDESPAFAPNGQPIMRPPKLGEAPVAQQGMPGMQPGMVQAKVRDVVAELLDKATKQSEKAQRRIDDWLQECQYHAEVRLVIESSARTGTGILKGPVPQMFKRRAVTRTLEGMGLILTEQINPVSKWVDVWDFFPDPSCGDNIHNGKYVFERQYMTARKLKELSGLDGYIAEAIDECLEEGPMSQMSGTTSKQDGREKSDKDQFEIWYYHGYLDSEELDAAGCECEEGKQIPSILTLVNGRVIKTAISPLDSGEFPYDVMAWQRRVGHWAGIGVARQMRTCQRGVNAAARNLMDNAGRSSRPYTVLRKGVIEPGPDQWTFYANEEAGDVSQFMTFFVMPSLQAELVNILQLFMKFAEDVTGLPMLIQGQLGKAPDTVGGMTLLNNNATSVLRRIARTFDDRVTEPHISRYYEWLLMYGDEDDEKGDFTIDARGSSALIERDQQNQAMLGLVQLSANPAFGLDPEKVMQEALKAQRLDPKRLELDEEKKAKMAQRPPPPQIAVAQIREQGATQRAQMQAQAKGQELQATMQKTQMELQADAAENEKDRMLEQWMAQVDAQLKSAELAGEQSMSLANIKQLLAREAMKLRTTKELAYAKAPASVMPKPPIEPQGRAPNGMSYQR